jgi:hypothetical protein
MYVSRPKKWRNSRRIIEESENIGTGKNAANALQHLLAAPRAEQPVVDERNPHGR